MTNPVEPVKSKVVGLIPVRIMLRNHQFLCNLLFFSAPFQTLYAHKAVSAKGPIKALKLPTESMIELDLPPKSLSISPQLLAGSTDAQFDPVVCVVVYILICAHNGQFVFLVWKKLQRGARLLLFRVSLCFFLKKSYILKVNFSP